MDVSICRRVVSWEGGWKKKAVPAFWSRFSTCGTPGWLFQFFFSSTCPQCRWPAGDTCGDTMFTTPQYGFNDKRSSPSSRFFKLYVRRAIDIRLDVSVQGGHKVAHGIGSFFNICSLKKRDKKRTHVRINLTWSKIWGWQFCFTTQLVEKLHGMTWTDILAQNSLFSFSRLRFFVASGVVIKVQ